MGNRCRAICISTQWINSNENDVCDHCYRLMAHTLCIDELVKYRKDFLFTLHLVRARQKCINLYADIIETGFIIKDEKPLGFFHTFLL